VNELISNAMKYAYNGEDDNRLEISIINQGSLFTLTVQDNGKGFDSSKPSKGFGLELVRNLSSQIDGTLSIEMENGTKCRLEFDIDE
jgi:two-component sensor histidine kinase